VCVQELLAVIKGKGGPILSSPKAKGALADHCMSLEATSRRLDLEMSDDATRNAVAAHFERLLAHCQRR
jgi:hypothetical protein